VSWGDAQQMSPGAPCHVAHTRHTCLCDTRQTFGQLFFKITFAINPAIGTHIYNSCLTYHKPLLNIYHKFTSRSTSSLVRKHTITSTTTQSLRFTTKFISSEAHNNKYNYTKFAIHNHKYDHKHRRSLTQPLGAEDQVRGHGL
jgi:hypothetical protein